MTASLIHLNGPACVGKSTIAASLVARRPLALCLDIDALRMQLGGWETEPEAKRVARDLAYNLAAHHLAAGRDVVVPQLDSRPEVIDLLAGIAEAAGASFHEIVLVADVEDLALRLERDGVDDAHPRRAFTNEELRSQMEYSLAHLPEMVAGRADAHVLDVSGLSVKAAAQAVEECLRTV